MEITEVKWRGIEVRMKMPNINQRWVSYRGTRENKGEAIPFLNGLEFSRADKQHEISDS